LNDVKNLADGLLSPSLRAKVQFLGGVSDEELLDHLQGASIFVSLSRSDGTSISLLEALACSLFPVISDITQNREWIDPQVQNGLLVPLDDPAALAAALQLAIVNEPLRRQAGLINRKLVLDRADFHKNMGLLARKLEDVVEKFHQT
jgi:glycosyltransferase involved in cell wall biosynthesis